MEQIVAGLLTTVVALLGGDRVIQGVRARRNHSNPVTKADIEKLTEAVGELDLKFERHLGYHEGVREA